MNLNKSEKNMDNNLEWKTKDKEYLEELQRFLDKTEMIKDEKIRHEILIQMLKCDDVLTKLCEKKISEVYKECNKN